MGEKELGEKETRAQRRVDNAYAWGLWPTITAHAPTIFLMPYLNIATGTPIAVLGLIATLSRIYDAAFDPLMGVISDRTRSRFGRRKPWVLIGSIGVFLTVLAGALVLRHPPQRVSTFWLAAILLTFFTAWTSFYIPYMAHAGEITTDYNRRSRINLLQGLIHIVTGLAIYLIPYLLVDPGTLFLRVPIADALSAQGVLPGVADWLRFPAKAGLANYGRVILVLAWITVITLPIIIWRYLRYVPEEPRLFRPRQGSPLTALRNPVFSVFCLGYLLLIAGYMGRLSLFPFVTTYANGGHYSFLLLMLIQGVSGIVTIPLWSRILMRVERVQALMIAAAVEAAGLLCLSLAGEGTAYMSLVAFALIGLPGGTLYLLPYTVAVDAADYAQFKHGIENRGVYISIISMIVKLGSVFSVAGLWIAGLIGFNPATGVTPHDITTLKTMGLYVPAALILIGAAIMMTFPVTRSRHRAIQTRLDRRKRAMTEAAPVTLEVLPTLSAATALPTLQR